MAYGARPVPQNIMSVEFKIFEFMNVKQFMFSFGLILFCGVLWWLMPSPWNIIVPLLLIVSGGIIIFVPFNGDPFMVFISSFLEAMISPQRRVWYRKGLLVKTAYRAARRYQYGNDPEEEANDFKFLEGQQINITPEQKELDKEEEQFLHKEAMNTNQSAGTTPQQRVAVPANVSQKAVQNSVSLNSFPQAQQGNSQLPNAQQAQPQPAQPQPNQNSVQQALPAQPQQQTPDMQGAVTELKDMMAPKTNNEEDDEVAVKNFIFGNVEDGNGKPIANAAVVVKQGPKNLEVVITGQGGDFITKYEYREGQYLLHVNVGAEEFNEVIIQHDPIDPLPILIHPKDYVDSSKQPKPAEPVFDVPNEDGIFEGAYDSRVFDLGVGYEEPAHESQSISQIQQETQQQSSPGIQQTIQPQPAQQESSQSQIAVPQEEMRQDAQQTVDSAPDQMNVQNPQVEQQPQKEEGLSFEEQMLGRVDTLHMPAEKQIPPTSQQVQQPQIVEQPQQVMPQPVPVPVIVSQPQLATHEQSSQQAPRDNTLSLKDFAQKPSTQPQEGGFRFVNDGTQPKEEIIEQRTIVPDQIQQQPIQPVVQSNDVAMLDFKSQPFSSATFNQGFVNMPNTVNGEVLDKNGNYLSGVFVDIKDMRGNTLRILQTASDGKFYTQSSMPYGQYLIGIRKDGYSFNNFIVNMDGGTIPPRVIQAM